ncbi:ATP-dependent metallopeptidase FtsH/Yme1/Tma family protein [Alloscardovia theropitheci]|uniref:ATP-dependent zinc metalloprotease FtsH n=1 Tax=Alloscardovia theropitheci TaxID=2496842 RepID=A0A4R0QPC0_9BIFI|nr:ATP-dependent zinc metalloprotease FtsH [Alloscardovia theropitheci]TCD54054.1 ATP-dependent metallopeptidase FtsH/Yme1/Tma family protein [Alloscardovia theropitheci]
MADINPFAPRDSRDNRDSRDKNSDDKTRNNMNNSDGNQPDSPRWWRRPWLWVVVLAALLLSVFFFVNRSDSQAIDTKDGFALIQKGKAEYVEITDNYQSVRLTLKDDFKKKDSKDKNAREKNYGKKVQFYYSSAQGADLNKLLKTAKIKNGYNVNIQFSNPWIGILSSLLPILLLFGMMWWVMSRLGDGSGGMLGLPGGNRNKRLQEADIPKTKFADVAGEEAAVTEVEEIKDFLKDPTKYRKLGARIPHGLLLYGPPGTGKTLIARAIAGEAGVPFYSMAGSDFEEVFVGLGASRVRELFEEAKKNSPAIIFIDEIDAMGRRRSSAAANGSGAGEQTLNALLVEMDGFDTDTNIIIIAATNRPDVLDSALTRPGRFDRQVAVEAPDLKGREDILKVHAKGKPFAPDVDLHRIAVLTPGFTGADLANVLNEAALLTAREDADLIDARAIDEAVDRVMSGPRRRSNGMALEELRNTAYHEGGHAMVAAALHHTDPVTKVTILPRGRALGYTAVMPTEDRFSQSRNELLDQMAYAMGGRVAEEVVFHDPTTGASNDIEKATNIARRMVVEFGFSDKLGAIKWNDESNDGGLDGLQPRKYSDRTAEIIDDEVLKLVETAHEEAYEIVMNNRDVLDELVRQLLEKETLDAKELAEIFAPLKKAPERSQWLSAPNRKVSTIPPVEIPKNLRSSVAVDATSGAHEESLEVDSDGTEVVSQLDGTSEVASDGTLASAQSPAVIETNDVPNEAGGEAATTDSNEVE